MSQQESNHNKNKQQETIIIMRITKANVELESGWRLKTTNK